MGDTLTREELEERAAIIADGELTDYRDPAYRRLISEKLAAEQAGYRSWSDAMKAVSPD